MNGPRSEDSSFISYFLSWRALLAFAAGYGSLPSPTWKGSREVEPRGVDRFGDGKNSRQAGRGAFTLLNRTVYFFDATAAANAWGKCLTLAEDAYLSSLLGFTYYSWGP